MAINIKIAASARELDDVYRLRYDVYVEDDKKFNPESFPDGRMVDRFDAMSNVANIIAYNGATPIATLRLNKSSEVGLPSDDLYDFSLFREKVQEELQGEGVIVSCGMLCVHRSWRRKREVIFAVFKMAVGIGFHWSTTHGIATVSKESVSLYGRIGYEPISEPIWIEKVGNHIVPMVADYQQIHHWAFADLLGSDLDRFWLDSFAGNFERVLLQPEEVLFTQGDEAQDAYIVDNGWVTISRRGPEGQELVIANLSRGALFGELALVDNDKRSATATSVGRVELIRLRKDVFSKEIKNDDAKVQKLLQVFAGRIRQTDELAMVLAYAPQAGRVKFALEKLKNSAVKDKKRAGVTVIKFGPEALAKTAGVRESEVLGMLELEKAKGNIEFGKNVIRFLSVNN